MEGIFTISLDFELHWGVFDKRDRIERQRIYQNTLNLIPEMLKMFKEYEVHVTWATVGALFAKDQQEWEELKPAIEPDYLVERYSAYKWVQLYGLPEQYRWAHFAPEMIRNILSYPWQELGTHTFSHYYCLEQQKLNNAFKEDLLAVKRASEKFDQEPVSLVFPRNQFNPDFLKVCFDNGIKVVRSNPGNWFWSPVPDKGSNLLRKVVRTADIYVQIGNQRSSYPLSKIKVTPGEPLQLPASRLFRPSKYKFANKLGLRRLMKELTKAARQKECYHLWWHPENFGDRPEENLENLRKLLQHYKKLKERYGMQSWNMGEYAEHLL